jgi:hypothetical protein
MSTSVCQPVAHEQLRHVHKTYGIKTSSSLFFILCSKYTVAEYFSARTTFFFCYYVVRMCLCGTAAIKVPIIHPPDDTWVNVEQWWILTRETEGLGEKPVVVPHCPPQTPYGLFWERTRALRGEKPVTKSLCCGTAAPSMTYIPRREGRRLWSVVAMVTNGLVEPCYKSHLYKNNRSDTLKLLNMSSCTTSEGKCSRSENFHSPLLVNTITVAVTKSHASKDITARPPSARL